MRVRKGLVGGTEPALLNLTDLDFLKQFGAFQLKFCEICKSYRQPFLRKKKNWGGGKLVMHVNFVLRMWTKSATLVLITVY